MKDKIVFVTGGANGIGKAIVSTFCRAGADVVFCDIDDVGASAVCKAMEAYKCSYVKVDISDIQSFVNELDRVLKDKGNIDIVVNNAGVSPFKSILDTSIEEFSKILDINLRSVFITSKVLVAHRATLGCDNKYGRIINIASTRYLMSEPKREAYAASKGGIVSLTHALAVSLSEYNITVNCISPGWIETNDYQDLKAQDHAQHPSQRVGKPDDIAQACLFLANPENNFINGQNIVIDGGMTKKMIYQ